MATLHAIDPSPALTEERYLTRSAELKRHIVAAENDRKAVAYRLELGQASREDLEEARRSIEELQDRLGGLEEAWRQALEAAVLAAEQRRRDEMASDRAALLGLQRDMVASAARQDDLLAALEAEKAEFERLRANVVTLAETWVLARPGASTTTRESNMQSVNAALSSSPLDGYVSGRMYRAGFKTLSDWNAISMARTSQGQSLPGIVGANLDRAWSYIGKALAGASDTPASAAESAERANTSEPPAPATKASVVTRTALSEAVEGGLGLRQRSSEEAHATRTGG